MTVTPFTFSIESGNGFRFRRVAGEKIPQTIISSSSKTTGREPSGLIEITSYLYSYRYQRNTTTVETDALLSFSWTMSN